MKLSKWVEKQVKETKEYKTTVLKKLAERSGVSFLTLQKAELGAMMGSYKKAKSVSEATGGKVTVKDLCEE